MSQFKSFRLSDEVRAIITRAAHSPASASNLINVIETDAMLYAIDYHTHRAKELHEGYDKIIQQQQQLQKSTL